MRKTPIIAAIAAACVCSAGCGRERAEKDRSQADEMYRRICELTREYTDRLHDAPDSTDWAATCAEFEDRLDKVSFSYPPDTDLLLTEGQNDTIYTLMQEYARIRDRRIHGVMYPYEETDTVAAADSLGAARRSEVSPTAATDR